MDNQQLAIFAALGNPKVLFSELERNYELAQIPDNGIIGYEHTGISTYTLTVEVAPDQDMFGVESGDVFRGILCIDKQTHPDFIRYIFRKIIDSRGV